MRWPIAPTDESVGVGIPWIPCRLRRVACRIRECGVVGPQRTTPHFVARYRRFADPTLEPILNAWVQGALRQFGEKHVVED
jgi:hypothetical protein